MAFHRLVEFFSVCCCHLWWHKIKKAKETKNILGKTKMNEMKKFYDSKQVISIGTLLNRARAPSQRTIHTVGEKDWTEKKTQIVSDYRHYFVRYYSCNNLLMWCIFFFLYSHVFWYRLIFWTNAAINGENWAPCLIYWFDFDRRFQIANLSKFVTHMMLDRWNR